MMGESRGIKQLNTLESKTELQNGFISWANADQERAKKYGKLLTVAESTYGRIYPCDLAGIFITEGFQGIELLKFAGGFRDFVKLAEKKETNEQDLFKSAEKLKAAVKAFFKDYQPNLDKRVAVEILSMISKGMDPSFKPDYFTSREKKQQGKWNEYVDHLYAVSVFADSARLLSILSAPGVKKLRKLASDPAYQLSASSSAVIENKINPVVTDCNRTIDSIQRIYVEGMMLYNNKKAWYPDANLTLRIAYGKVDDYHGADAVSYSYFTTVKGILQKENPGIYDYVVEPKLKDLILGNDFGMYADRDGSMHVAFTASNHTTGGNSGSPVLDGSGRLIGLNFDRNWEGTMSDLQYDPEQCRNIVLDIRYCLFIIDRFAGARRLIDEMDLVK